MSVITFTDKDQTAAPGETTRQISASDVNALKAGINSSLQYVTVALTDAQVKALDSAAVTLIAAPGANMIVVPVHVTVVNASAADSNASVYVGYSGLAEGSGLEVLASIQANRATMQTFPDRDQGTIVSDYTTVVNKAIRISSVDPISSGSTFVVKVTIAYYIMSLS